MADWNGYDKVTSDDMRIFGLCINGQNTRINPVTGMKTLLLESKACFTVRQIESYLNTILGGGYTYEPTDSWGNMGGRKKDNENIVNDPDAKPVFVNLEFDR